METQKYELCSSPFIKKKGILHINAFRCFVLYVHRPIVCVCVSAHARIFHVSQITGLFSSMRVG